MRARALSPPTTPFSVLQGIRLTEIAGEEKLIAHARISRNDLLASRKREDAADVQVAAAMKNLLPQFDFTYEMGYAGLEEGDVLQDFFSAYGRHTSGLNVFAGLRLSLPVENNTARGELVRRRSVYRQQTRRTLELERQTLSNILVALSALRRSAEEFARSMESVAYYRETVENERQKLNLGMSTLIDLVTYEDRLTGAEANVVAKQLKYATALVRLRFETGTLVAADPDEPEKSVVEMEAFTRVPRP